MINDGLSTWLRIFVPLIVSGALLCDGLSYASSATEKAREYFASGDRRAAVIELKDALQQDPGDITARVLLGEIYLDMQAGADAEKEFRRAAELGADPSMWRLELVDALLMQGKFSDALDSLDAFDEPLGGNHKAELMARRGAALLGLRRMSEAREAFAQALELDADNERAILGNAMLAMADQDFEGATALADRLIAKHPDSVEGLLMRAELYRKSGDLDAARTYFGRAIERRPNDMRALLGRATVSTALGQAEAAKGDLDRADEFHKGLPMTEYLRGVIAFQQSDLEQASQHLERVLASSPGHVESQLLLGVISFSRNDLELAEEYLSRVVSVRPGDIQASKMLAATRIKAGQPERAVALLEPLALRSTDAQLMALLGSAYVLSGEKEKGQEWLTRSVDAAPDVAALRTQLAMTLLAGGETDKAIAELQSAVDLGQDVLQADVLLVLAHLKNKEFAQALDAARALEARRPEDAIAYNLTGLIYLAQGDLDKAAERFGKALAVDPHFLTAELNLARVDIAEGDTEAAKGRYEHILAEHPKHLAAMLGLAGLAEARGDTKDMVAWLEKAQEANPDAAKPAVALARFYIEQKEPLKALSEANRLAGRFPNDMAVLEILARAQLLSGEVANAMRTLGQLAGQRPEDAGIQYMMGGAKWKAGDLAGARIAFQNAIELKPDFAEARLAFASVALAQGDVDDALSAAKKLQHDFPDSPAGLQLEGTIYLQQKQAGLAVAALGAAYAIKKTPAIVHALARAYAESDARPKAIDLLAGWVTEHAGDLKAWAALASLQQQAGRDQDAIRSYEALKAAGGGNAIILNNLAWLYYEVGDERALSTAREAYDLEPNRPEIADTYGWVLLKSGKPEEALSILQQAYVSYPTQTEIGFHVAVALKEAGRTDEAVSILRRLRRESPNSAQADEANALLRELEK